jgi:ABC-type multidrug transport system fused ATPase/permease subunit
MGPAADSPPEGAGLARSGLRLVGRFARMEPWPFALALFGGTAWAATVVGSTIVIGQVNDKAIVPVLAGEKGRGVALWAALALLAVGVLRGGSVVLRRWYGSVTEARVQAELRRQVADRVLAMPLSEHRKRPTGQLLALADSDVTFSTWALMPVPLTFGLVALLVFSVISLLVADWTFALIAAVLFPLLVLVSRWFSARMVDPATRSQEQVARVSGIAHESFEGAMVVKTLGREVAESGRFDDAAGALRTQRLRLAALSSSYHPLVDALPLLGMVALIVVGGYRVQAGAVTTGDVLAAVTLFGWLNFPVRVAGFLFESMPRSLVSMGRIESLLAVEDGADAAAGTWAGAYPPESLPGSHPDRRVDRLPAGAPSVRFEGVSFGFEPGPDVLTDVDLEVASGEVVALVGATGAGKSTLCELLARLDEPTAGRIVLGVSRWTTSRLELRSTVALVFQEASCLPRRCATTWCWRPGRSRGARRTRAGSRASLRRRVARWPRNDDGGAGRHPERWATPACRPRQGLGAPTPGAGARRCNLGGGSGGRGRDPGWSPRWRPSGRRRRYDGAGRCAPPIDDRLGRSRRLHGGRPYRGGRNPHPVARSPGL